MELNHILLFVALLSPIALLVRSHRVAKINRGWRAASIAVLIVTAGAWLAFPNWGGFIGGGAWFALLLLPIILSREIAILILRERLVSARRLADLLAVFHPVREARRQKQFLRAMETAQRGNLRRSLDLLESVQKNQSDLIARQAMAQIFRLRGDWENLVRRFRSEIWPGGWQRDELLPLYFRALGETHRLDELALPIAAYNQSLSREAPDSLTTNLSFLALWAFTGRNASLVRLLETSLRKLSAERKTFWIATGDLASGNVAAGRDKLVQLQSQTSDAMLRSEIAARLDRVNDYADAARACSLETNRILQRLENRPMKSAPYATRAGPTPVVLTLICLCVAMFLLEILLGGSTNPLTLHNLGQLETWDFLASREYWRVLTFLFLHYGPIHLLFNIYALYVLGPALERSLGVLRFLACYLISGIGSGLGVVTLHVLGLTPAQEVVGASGCIMGIVGAWAGFLLRYRHLPLARRRLQNVVMIVVIQTLFDLSTPQVSMASHLCGLITGFFVGLILAPRNAEKM
jgi:rhomboid protease GluP